MIMYRMGMFLMVLCTLASSIAVRADDETEKKPEPPKKEEHRLKLDPNYKKVTIPEYAVFGTLGALDVAGLAAIPAPTQPRWTATNSFDDAFRNTLRFPTRAGRDAIDTTSTALVGALALVPLIDAVGVAWIGDKNPKVAGQMLAQDLESYSTILAALVATKNSAARARPYTRDCANNDCTASDRYESFFSGHTALAFNSAGTICMQHLNLKLYGSKAADGTVCGLALATATGVGVMRIAADKHYASDILVGGALGSVTGFLIPALHFGGHGAVDTDTGKPRDGVSVSLSPVVSKDMQGFQAVGTF